MTPLLPLPLVRLGFRRTLSAPGWACIAAVLLLAATRRPELGATVPGPSLPGAGAAWSARSVWGTFFLVALFVFTWRAARLGNAWRTREFAWLGRLPPGAGPTSAASVLGLGAAAFTATFLALVVARVSSPGDALPPPRFLEALSHRPLLLSSADTRDSVHLAAPRATARATDLLVVPSVAPGSGPAVDLRLTLRAADGSESGVTRRIFARTPLVLTLPGPGPWELELSRGPGAAVYLPGESVALLAPAVGPWSRDLGLFWRCGWALFGFAALAMALGAWMRLSLAFATGLCACLAPWTSESGSGLTPVGDLSLVLERLALGIGPGPLPVSLPLAALGFAAGAILLPRVALRQGGEPR